MTQEPLALYFGVYESGRPGHHLYRPASAPITVVPEYAFPGFPWAMHLLDTRLLRNRRVADELTGHVHWTCGGLDEFWIGFFWWDRSGDSRSNSNSGFYVRGFGPASHVRVKFREAFDFACQSWPQIVKRQQFPLVLID